jgi:hypothetical protein
MLLNIALVVAIESAQEPLKSVLKKMDIPFLVLPQFTINDIIGSIVFINLFITTFEKGCDFDGIPLEKCNIEYICDFKNYTRERCETGEILDALKVS